MSDVNLPDQRRKQLEDENRDCPYCGGSGLCLVFHPRHNGTKQFTVVDHRDRLHTIAAEVGAHCRCPVGVWMRERSEPEVQRRTPWVQDIIEDRSKWLLFPPGEVQADAGEVPNAPPTKAAIRGAMKSAY